jgi:hypothetical protein
MSITEEQAKNYAESLYSAFNYYWGTDKQVISNVFSKINSEDFKLVYKHCHYINIDTNFPPCPKCETMKFSQAIREQGDVTYYYAVCDNCQLQTLLGYYVSTIKSCEDGACKL